VQARSLLEAADWNLETATELFFSQNDMDVDEEEHIGASDDDDNESSPSDSRAQPQAEAGPKKGSGVVKPGYECQSAHSFLFPSNVI
jgi:hypothetical protein